MSERPNNASLAELKRFVKSRTDINLLDVLRSPLKTPPPSASFKYASQINKALRKNKTNAHQDFNSYISTNLIDVLKQDRDSADGQTKLTIHDSFLTQRNIGDQQDQSCQEYRSQDFMNRKRNSEMQYQTAQDMSKCYSDGSKNLASFLIRRNTGLKAKSNMSPKSSQRLSVMTTSKVEKSIDEDGHSKINNYTIDSKLGQGAFGKVKLAHDGSGDYYAIKIANKKKLKRKMLSVSANAYLQLEKEIAIMKKIRHDNVVQLMEVIDDPDQDKLYLVMEFMEKGSILSKTFFKKSQSSILEELKETERKSLTEEESRFYFRQFILGLDYLHNCVGVIHRDIKPENLLVSMDNVLKIADFGVSHIMENDDSIVKSQTGTQAFLAPEAWTSKNFDGKGLDIWAGGVTLYQMIYGKLPFPSQQSVILKQQILTVEPLFEEREGYPPQAINFLKRLLEKDPAQRIAMNEILIDPWLTNDGTEPLTNDGLFFEEVNDQDIKSALTKLNISMAIKTATRMLSKVRDTRLTLSTRRSPAAPENKINNQ